MRTILVTGATGKQGGSVVQAIAARYSSEFTILAVTRSPSSPKALQLKKTVPNLKLVQGDLDDVPALFKAAKTAAQGAIWGVYSVQAAVTKGTTFEGEIAQGKALIDAAVQHDVKHFVYSSVDRGGNERSWNNPTSIPHFKAKHAIEHHLRAQTAKSNAQMGWTILRPVIFFDNIVPEFPSKVFMTSLRAAIKDKPLQWIATSDIGVFAAEAFHDPSKFNHAAIGLAGEQLTFKELDQKFRIITGQGIGTTVGLLGKILRAMVKDVDLMLTWFHEEGYNVDLDLVRSIHPSVKDTAAWLRQDSLFGRE